VSSATRDWEQVLAAGCPSPAPTERLDVATALVSALADPDTRLREIVAPAVFTSWVEQGDYDDLLPGLGDGLLAGLRPARVSAATADVDAARDVALHGRCGRAGALAVVVARDNRIRAVPRDRVLDWADRCVSWLLAERDLRTSTPLGAADALSRGAQLVATLAASPVLGAEELQVLLDVVAERAGGPADLPLTPLQADALAFAAVSVLARDLVDPRASEAWVEALGEAACGVGPPTAPGTTPRAGTLALLGSLHTQLVLGVVATPVSDLARQQPGADPDAAAAAPRDRTDLVLAVQGALRVAAPWLYRTAT
jgi:hypothetical protein